MIDDLVTRGVTRALPDVHVAGGVPAVAAGRQRRPAADADGHRAGPGRRASARRPLRRGWRRWTAARALVEALDADAERGGSGTGFTSISDGVRRTAFDLLAYPEIDMARPGAIWPELAALDRFASEQIEIDAQYAVYLERQAADIASFRRDEAVGDSGRSRLRRAGRPVQRAREKLAASAAGDAGAGGADRGHDAGGAGADPGARSSASGRECGVKRAWRTTARRCRTSSLFHVKQRSGSRRYVALLRQVAAGGEPGRAERRCRPSGGAMSPTARSLSRCFPEPGAGSTSAAAPASRAGRRHPGRRAGDDGPPGREQPAEMRVPARGDPRDRRAGDRP